MPSGAPSLRLRALRQSGARRLRALTAATVAAAGFAAVTATFATTASAAGAYVNPFAADAFVGRTDMGVDLCMNVGDPILAVGDGVVSGIEQNWYAGQPYVWYQLSSGSHAGDYVYVAEQIKILVKVGQQLKAGQVIARYAKNGTCIETGWSEADGETTAAATTGYSEGEVTVAGASFARFLISLGVSGNFELHAATPKPAASKAKPKKKTSTPKTPVKPTTPTKPTLPASGATPTKVTTPVAPAKPARPTQTATAKNSGSAAAQPSGAGQPTGGGSSTTAGGPSGGSDYGYGAAYANGGGTSYTDPGYGYGSVAGSGPSSTSSTSSSTPSTPASGSPMPSWSPGGVTYAGRSVTGS